MKKIAIVMGSDSDLGVMSEAAKFLDEMGVPYYMSLVSAHRTPDRLYDFAKSAAEGFGVIIAGAGGAAHLPGMLASLTNVPVIGVPVKSAALSGVDSLYSIVSMPAGVPVATVAINGAKNAAILACQMLAIGDAALYEKLDGFKDNLKNKVLEKADNLAY